MPILALFFLLFLATPAFAMSADDALEQSKVLAAEKKYDEALALLEKEEAKHPKDIELKLAIARVLSWKGDYDLAEQKLSKLDKEYDANADVLLLRANLAYYRHDTTTAKTLYKKILNDHPHYEDAKAGLARTQKAEDAPVQATPYRWQVDIGYEHSGFSRRKQPSWNQEFLQVTHFLEDKTALHGKITRYDQFNTNIDTEFEIGVDHAFTEYLNAYAYGAITPEADFRPEHRVAGGGALRLMNKNDGFLPVWLTMDSRYDAYASVSVLNVNPGLRIEPVDGWSLAVRKISVDADNAKRVYGESYRLDGTVTDRLRFYVGYADAPETEAAVTVNTKTYFGGIAFDMTPESTLRLGYTHDDRENSYIRKVVNASVSYKF